VDDLPMPESPGGKRRRWKAGFEKFNKFWQHQVIPNVNRLFRDASWVVWANQLARHMKFGNHLSYFVP
jgi:hypothetical protein